MIREQQYISQVAIAGISLAFRLISCLNIVRLYDLDLGASDLKTGVLVTCDTGNLPLNFGLFRAAAEFICHENYISNVNDRWAARKE